MSKARDWPAGWQMPGPRAVPTFANAPPPGLTRGANARGGGGLGAGGIDWCIREFKTVLDSGFHNVDSTPRIPVSRYLIPVWIPIAGGIPDSKLHEKNQPFFVLYFFTLGESVILVSLAHFPRFCWQYFSLSNVFSIHLARKTYSLPCSGFWNIFLTLLSLFWVQN